MRATTCVARDSAGAVMAGGKGVRGGGGGVLVWFRRDLRLHDNETIHQAAARARQLQLQAGHAGPSHVDFCYVHRREGPGGEEPWHRRQGGASLAFLGATLRALDARLCETWGQGSKLIYRECEDDDESLASTLAEVARACGSAEVFFGRGYEPKLREEESRAQLQLSKAHGLRSKSFATFLLHEPDQIAIDMGKWKGHFGTLMPFYNACKAQKRPATAGSVLPAPTADAVPARGVGASVATAHQWTLENPRNTFRDFLYPETSPAGASEAEPDSLRGREAEWVGKLVRHWLAEPNANGPAPPRGVEAFGEKEALRLLDDFVRAKMKRYESSRGLADARGVSKLSPYLHFGCLSARHMVSVLQGAGCQEISKTFWRRLVWRDLAYWQLHHWPLMATQPIRSFYAKHAWTEDAGTRECLERWQYGRTGFPLVDAGMRELWQTGWMQQNARMCCALFLTEYLNLPWTKGAEWFHDTLFDADLAINAMMWQNAGKSGLDQWNFTVGPTAKSLDPTGAYIKRWVPELRSLPKEHLHAPWEATKAVRAQAGVFLGVTYPERIASVADVAAAKRRNLEAVRGLREIARKAGFVDENGYDVIKAPQGSCRGNPNGSRVRVFTKPEYRNPNATSRGGGGGGRGKGKGNGKTLSGEQATAQRKKRAKASAHPKSSKVGKRDSNKVVYKQLSFEEALRMDRSYH